MSVCIYLLVVAFIFKKRKQYPIYNRSPKLIMFGAFGNIFDVTFFIGLLLDSISNVII